MIFSIAMVDDYSFDVKNIDIWVPAFFKHNNSFIATVDNLKVSKIMSPNSDFSEFIYRVYYEFNEKFLLNYQSKLTKISWRHISCVNGGP